jgi:hypothetical protein
VTVNLLYAEDDSKFLGILGRRESVADRSLREGPNIRAPSGLYSPGRLEQESERPC